MISEPTVAIVKPLARERSGSSCYNSGITDSSDSSCSIALIAAIALKVSAAGRK